ncbi:hypothetical protein [Rhodococcus sp. 24CO]|uniref:hypothetical protein n=1 Tax=Rhodococcus sp. 24CO TaxID=3117460 RepID=UPI003D32680F
MDINDGWEPTLPSLEWDDRARAAGIIALIGMGGSPGVSNVLAAAELDTVHELYPGWVVAGTESEPGGARPAAPLLHLVHECTGRYESFRGGTPSRRWNRSDCDIRASARSRRPRAAKIVKSPAT